MLEGSPVRTGRPGGRDPFEAQQTPRTAFHALAAGQAVAVLDRLAPPHVLSHVDLHGAVERADSALDATAGFRHDPRRRESRVPRLIGLEPVQGALGNSYVDASGTRVAASTHGRLPACRERNDTMTMLLMIGRNPDGALVWAPAVRRRSARASRGDSPGEMRQNRRLHRLWRSCWATPQCSQETLRLDQTVGIRLRSLL